MLPTAWGTRHAWGEPMTLRRRGQVVDPAERAAGNIERAPHGQCALRTQGGAPAHRHWYQHIFTDTPARRHSDTNGLSGSPSRAGRLPRLKGSH